MLKSLIAAIALLCALTTIAEARKMHPMCNVSGGFPCIEPYNSTPQQVRVTRGKYVARSFGFGAAIEKPRRASKADRRSQIRQSPTKQEKAIRNETASHAVPSPSVVPQVVGSRPSGCPTAYCGCGAALEVFGKIIPALNLAANWLRFPRTAPAPGMVAARRGHVFVLKSEIKPGIWLVHDSNSGRHLTRIHARSIAGYVIVNPRGWAA